MGLLLDTHILLPLLEERLDDLDETSRRAIENTNSLNYASVVSLWEISIKSRLGKLALLPPLSSLPDLLDKLDLVLLDIKAPHVLTAAQPEPLTRDPFDRLLLSQCQIENLRLVTLDKALSGHPLAWRPS